MVAAAQAEQQIEQSVELCRCSTCNQDVEEKSAVCLKNEDPLKGVKNQWRCRLCHNAMGRVRTAFKSMSEEQKLGFQDLTLVERREFYKKAQTLCGAHLQKTLTESITTSTIRKISETSHEDGHFLPIKEVEAEWSQKRPEMWAQLELHAPRLECKYTGAELIMVPSYSYKRARETCDSTTNVRKLESDQCVKKIKVTKENQVKGTQEEDQGNPAPKHNKADIPKPITDAQQKRLNKIMTGLEQNKLKYADLCLHIDTNNAHESISERLMKRITDLSGNLDALIERTKNALSQNSISSNGLKDLSEAIKDTSPPLLELINNARASVDLFCSEDSSAAPE